MAIDSIIDFVEAVLTLHPSHPKLSPKLFPKVIVRRLSEKTIRKYTRTDNGKYTRTDNGKYTRTDNGKYTRTDNGVRSTSKSFSCSRREFPGSNQSSFFDESRTEGGNLPETPSGSEENFITSPKNCRFDKSQSTVSKWRKGNEDVSLGGLPVDGDSSDELPDLNNPSWDNEVMKSAKKKKKKERDAQKTDGKLMRSARRAFQHELNRLKSSQEFMKNSKVFKDVQNTESRPHNSNPQNVESQADDDRLSSSESDSCTEWSPQSHIRIATVETIKGTDKEGDIWEGSTRSPAELMSLKLKENIVRLAKPTKPSFEQEDVTCLDVQPSNPSDANDERQSMEEQSSQIDITEDSCDSDDSNCTVLFDDNDLKTMYDLSSSLGATQGSSVSIRDVVTQPKESMDTNKRKNSPLKSEELTEKNKKMKKDEGHDVIELQSNQHPMVTIPISIQSTISLAPSAATSQTPPRLVTSVTHEQIPSGGHSGAAPSSNTPSQTSEAAHSGRKGNDETVKEKEVSEVCLDPSPLVSVQDTREKTQPPSQRGHNECILIDDNSQEESSTDESGPTLDQVCAGDIEQQTICNLNKVTTNSVHKETARQEETANSSSKESPSQEKTTGSSREEIAEDCIESPHKSLRALSLHFHELTTKRGKCEQKMRLLKEEYERKNEPLEREKKNLDVEISKVIAAMSEWKSRYEEEQSTPDSHKGCAAASPSAAAREAEPDVSVVAGTKQNTPQRVIRPTTSASRSTDKKGINVISAASIKHFGRKKTPSAPKLVASSTPPQPSLSLIPIAVNASLGQENKVIRIISQVPSTSLSSSSGSGNLVPASGIQERSDMRQCTAFEKHPPPNAVVNPGQQHPALTSPHVLCRPPPLPSVRVAQRCAAGGRMVKPVKDSNTGSLRASYRNPVSSQPQQNLLPQVQPRYQYMPPQLQQQQPYHEQQQQRQQHTQLLALLQKPQLQQQQFQQLPQQQVQLQSPCNVQLVQQSSANNSQCYQQQYQPVLEQLQNNGTPFQGRNVPGTYTAAMASNNVICNTAQVVPSFMINTVVTNEGNTTPTNRIKVTHPQQGNSLTANGGIEKANCSSNATHFQLRPNPAAGNKVMSVSFPPASHPTTTAATAVSSNNMNIPSLTNTQAPSANRVVNARTVAVPAAPALQIGGDFSQENSVYEQPICVMCGSAATFTCCNNVIYCSTRCQGNDWSTHQHKCINTSSSLEDTS